MCQSRLPKKGKEHNYLTLFHIKSFSNTQAKYNVPILSLSVRKMERRVVKSKPQLSKGVS